MTESLNKLYFRYLTQTFSIMFIQAKMFIYEMPPEEMLAFKLGYKRISFLTFQYICIACRRLAGNVFMDHKIFSTMYVVVFISQKFARGRP